MTDGIERVISKAAADSRFRQRLLSDREAALGRCRVPLTDSERAILLGIPDDQLATIVANAPAQMAPRRGFIGTAIASLGALLGGAAVATQSGCPGPGPVTGARPDEPPVEREGDDTTEGPKTEVMAGLGVEVAPERNES